MYCAIGDAPKARGTLRHADHRPTKRKAVQKIEPALRRFERDSPIGGLT
ncbi:MAG TPA: hypothetical protein VL134_13380 [Leptolyngbya sp.]|nr:hypothetical protein [Leptolyngbya sp.]